MPGYQFKPFLYGIGQDLQMSTWRDADVKKTYKVVARSYNVPQDTNFYELDGPIGQPDQAIHTYSEAVVRLLVGKPVHVDDTPNPCQYGVHAWVDDTALRTWCKDCDLDAEWNRDTQQYDHKHPIKEII